MTEVRSQLRVLETIDRIVSKRKQEQEQEQKLKAAKSRSKGADPEKTAKIREEAKQVWQESFLFSFSLIVFSLSCAFRDFTAEGTMYQWLVPK